tara:strand:+ start:9807 stop:10184 length:378 start_codon:yes stop_codon:yes gene_type:complete
MKNYEGNGAYIIVSLLDENKEYIRTLQIIGDDPEWYNEIDSWWAFFGKTKQKVDAITGATLSAGQRRVITFSINKLPKNSYIRFETAVEENLYYESEVDVAINELAKKQEYEGTGYIRYLKFIIQ